MNPIRLQPLTFSCSVLFLGGLFLLSGCRNSFNFWGPSISLQQERPVGLAPAAILVTATDADGISSLSVKQKTSTGEKLILNHVYSSPAQTTSEEIYVSVAAEPATAKQFILEITALDAKGRNARKEYAVPFNNHIPSVSVVTAPSTVREGEPAIAVVKSNPENLESAGLIIGTRTIAGTPLSRLGRGGPANLFLVLFTIASQREAASVRAYARNSAFNTDSEPVSVSFAASSHEDRRIKMKQQEISFLLSSTKALLRSEAKVLSPSLVFSDTGLDSSVPPSAFFGSFLELNNTAIKRFLAQKLNSYLYPKRPLLRPSGLVVAPFSSRIIVVGDEREYELGLMPFEFHETTSTVVEGIGEGTVVFSQNLGPLGTVVGVDVGLGIVVVYGLLEKSPLTPGARVFPSSIIGSPLHRSGSGYGNYFVGAYLGGVPIDPKYLSDDSWFSTRLEKHFTQPQ